jgi:hypothetical protein
MVLWQFIGKCLIIFIVQLNKELIKKKVGCPGGDQISMLSQMLIQGLGGRGSPVVSKGTELHKEAQPREGL